MLSYELNNLPGDTTFSHLLLRAVNNFGMMSNPASCDDVQTLKPSEVYRIKKEIERVKLSSNDIIDTDFFKGGIQRQKRTVYLFKLEQTLKAIDSDATCIDGYKDGTNSKPNCNDESCNGNNRNLITPKNFYSSDKEHDYNDRRRQFDDRLRVLLSQMEKCKKKCHDIITKRVYLTFQLEHLQERVIVLKVELVRTASITDTSIDSTVIGGIKQNFSVVKLRKLLEEELSNALSQLVAYKTDIIEGEKELEKLSDEVKRKEDSVQERKVAYELFKKRVKSTARARLITSKQPQDIIQYYFFR